MIRTGEFSDKVYFVNKGVVQVYVKDLTSKTLSGRWTKLVTLKKGDCFNFAGAILQRQAIFEFVAETLEKQNESIADHLEESDGLSETEDSECGLQGE